jgi:hypothetical protein
MDPAFPDIVGDWAQSHLDSDCGCANDNPDCDDDEVVEALLVELAKLDIEATRAW